MAAPTARVAHGPHSISTITILSYCGPNCAIRSLTLLPRFQPRPPLRVHRVHSAFTPTHREDLLESMDVARDLHLVGGLAPLIEVLRSDNPDLRCGAANALAVW